MMFDRTKLKEILDSYKKDLAPKLWQGEKYKWKAVKTFRENWDINAADFADMLERSLADTGNLLAAGGFFPSKMIIGFAKVAPAEVRDMFAELFDENKDVCERIESFRQRSDMLLEEYGNGAANHYQTENSISVYLWLRYPEKYYIYRLKRVKKAAAALGAGYVFKKGAYAENIRNCFAFYDELSAELRADGELRNILDTLLTEEHYPDPQLHTLAADLVFYISCDDDTEQPPVQLPPVPDDEEHVPEKYGREDFLREVYMSGERYDRLAAAVKKKMNVILQGAPGVGKTFAAKRLAYSLMGERDESRVELVQFHQNYSYEDFVMGYKPSGSGFELKRGVFCRFCGRAAADPDRDYFFIIDEVNRGNMSRIFGELLMLIEKDYRGEFASLAYSGERFTVPKNLYIIGMMNTADRSLAMIDYALRRRFGFFDMEPGFDTEGFVRYRKSLNSPLFDELVSKIKELNRDIAADRSLGKGFCIGHSYFCGGEEYIGQGDGLERWLKDTVDFDILPTLAEYWFDDPAELRRREDMLRSVFK